MAADSPSAFKFQSEAWTLDSYQRECLLENTPENTLTEIIRDFCNARSHRKAEAISPLKPTPGSLANALIRQIYRLVASSGNVDAELCTILNSAEPLAISRLIFGNGALPHTAYLAYRRLLQQHLVPNIEEAAGLTRSIDEAVIENESYLKSRVDSGDDGLDRLYLLTLADFEKTLCGAYATGSVDGLDREISFKRSRISPLELPLLDSLWAREISVRGSNASFQSAFNWATMNALRGLDWSNVLAVGGTVLSTLVAPSCSPRWRSENPQHHPEPKEHFWSIEINLYKLSAEEANSKLQHIFDIWSQNMPQGLRQPKVFRGPLMISFLCEESYVQIYILLHIFQSKTEALLKKSIDAYALAYDGSELFMLPRCARAIETGYTVLKSCNLLGHAENMSMATQERRLVACGELGFGVRILPIYSKTLEDGALDEELESKYPSNENWKPKTLRVGHRRQPRGSFSKLLDFRKPDGPEDGAKTLRRIAFLMQDRVNSCRIVTPLSKIFEEKETRHTSKEHLEEFRKHVLRGRFDYLGRKKHLLKTLRRTEDDDTFKDCLRRQLANLFNDLDDSYDSTHSARTLESLVEANEAWSLSFDPQCARDSILYRQYTCARDLREIFTEADYVSVYMFDRPFMDDSRLIFETDLIPLIEMKTGRQARIQDFVSYLTGRVTLHRVGDSLQDALARSLRFPLEISQEIEDALKRPSVPLVPLYDSRAHTTGSSYQGNLPPLPETASSKDVGNLRYLLYNTASMWRGLDKEHDCIMDILFSLSRVLWSDGQATSYNLRRHTDTSTTCSLKLLEYLQRSDDGILPQVSHSKKWGNTVLTLREAMIFRSWVLGNGRLINDSDYPRSEPGLPCQIENYVYPVPDELFWGPELKLEGHEEDREQPLRSMPWWFREAAYADAAKDIDEDADH